MTTLVTNELYYYLAEQIIPRTPDFDILLGWKLNGAKYHFPTNCKRFFGHLNHLCRTLICFQLLWEAIRSPHEKITPFNC
ncbi:hypothetical protein LINPERPRIM_LOCUS6327 [Linum perenne]